MTVDDIIAALSALPVDVRARPLLAWTPDGDVAVVDGIVVERRDAADPERVNDFHPLHARVEA